MEYVKDTPRITVKFINADTEEVIFEITDRSWMTVGELFTDGIATSLMIQEFKNKKKPMPKNIMILAVGEYKQIE
ncbi:MAG: hypothetical protein WC333_00445 [Dehalococcoidia bacterium]|jgi:hypothetical protein